MTSLKQLIQRNLNPFDPSTFRPGNFWQEHQNPALEVDSIHRQVLQTIDQTLDQTATDKVARTVLLEGESGAGKSYLLGRLKRQLNRKAFFAYIGPWPDSAYLWQHTLRSVVDSLIQIPEGQSESQLLLWLKGLPSLHNQSLVKWVLGERGTFIQDLQASFPVGITNGKEFFGVLYDLATNTDLRTLAYNWLKGDNLDKEDLKLLRVKQPIDSEDAAYKILSNMGRIAASTQPIVLCFDNLDSIPRLANDRPDLQSLFNLNSTIHNEKLRNFLVVISIVTRTWRINKKAIQVADIERIDQTLQLKQIDLDQAEALWASRLAPIHAQIKPKPASAIAPLSHDWLTHKFPRHRALARHVLQLGQQLITDFKSHDGHLPIPGSPQAINGGIGAHDDEPKEMLASFQLTWDKEFQKVHERLARMGQFTSPDLIWRLQEVLEALEVSQVTAQFLESSKYASYSLSHHQNTSVGIVWNEDPNMTTFFHVMKACQRITDKKACDRFYLIRSGSVGRSNTKGNQIYRQMFNGQAASAHLKPDLRSVQYLETYHQLANAARGGELVVASKTPNLRDLQALVRESQVLKQCPLLQDLDIVTGDKPILSLEAVRDYILNLMKTQLLIGLVALIENAQQQFSNLKELEIETVIQTLCQEKHLQVLDPQANRQGQLICLVAK